MNRRKFLKASAVLPAFFTLSPFGLTAKPNDTYDRLLTGGGNDRVLVVVQLFGGNDGISTLVPLDQYEGINAVRRLVTPEENEVLPIGNDLALHPAMENLQQLYDDQLLGIVQSVGYPAPNRSHFRSSDIWATGSAADETLQTGWIGRYLDTLAPDYPAGYPNAEYPHPLAVSFSTVAHTACNGPLVNFSQTINPYSGFTTVPEGVDTRTPDDTYGAHLDYLRTTIEQNNTYGAAIEEANEQGTNMREYPATRLADQLRNVARLISGGLETKIYMVRMEGFDLHADQASNGNPGGGNHADLLREVSDALLAFQQDLILQGLDERVLGFTYSEFGRRIHANASRGTDHGDAGPMFVFGGCAAGGVLGDNVKVDPDVSIYDGVPMQFDYRDVYGTLLVDWLGAEEQQTRELLGYDFQKLPLVDSCGGGVLDLGIGNFVVDPDDIRTALIPRWQALNVDLDGCFLLERSVDQVAFRTLGRFPATPGQRDFEVTDREVVTDQTYYYRLSFLDDSNNVRFSQVQTGILSGTSATAWRVQNPYPNPARHKTTLRIDAPTDGMVLVRALDLRGREVFSTERMVSAGAGRRLTLNLGRVASGIYTLRIRMPEGLTTTRKLVVNR